MLESAGRALEVKTRPEAEGEGAGPEDVEVTRFWGGEIQGVLPRDEASLLLLYTGRINLIVTPLPRSV